jgi:hypothetical protein
MIRITSLMLFGLMAVSSTAYAADNARTDNLPEKGSVTIAGTVSKITDSDEFDLSYDGGMIHVDTNDAWPNIFKKDANNAAKQLMVGDHVVVMGKIDDNFFSKREIDAKSLRFEQGGQIFSYGDMYKKDSMNVSR